MSEPFDESANRPAVESLRARLADKEAEAANALILLRDEQDSHTDTHSELTRVTMRLAEAEQLLKAAVDAWRGDGPPLELDRIDAFLATTDSASVQHEPDPPYGSEAYLFRELMAIMHGDGGHYHAQHGAQKAYEDACTKYWRLVVTAEKTAKDVRATDEAGVTTDRESESP